MIPKTQFNLFVVTSVYTGNKLGVYQTFGEAYRRISEIVKGRPLIEQLHMWNEDIVYYFPENNPNDMYSIEPVLFTYNEDLPLVDLLYEKVKNEKEIISLLK